MWEYCYSDIQSTPILSTCQGKCLKLVSCPLSDKGLDWISESITCDPRVNKQTSIIEEKALTSTSDIEKGAREMGQMTH